MITALPPGTTSLCTHGAEERPPIMTGCHSPLRGVANDATRVRCEMNRVFPYACAHAGFGRPRDSHLGVGTVPLPGFPVRQAQT